MALTDEDQIAIANRVAVLSGAAQAELDELNSYLTKAPTWPPRLDRLRELADEMETLLARADVFAAASRMFNEHGVEPGVPLLARYVVRNFKTSSHVGALRAAMAALDEACQVVVEAHAVALVRPTA